MLSRSNRPSKSMQSHARMFSDQVNASIIYDRRCEISDVAFRTALPIGGLSCFQRYQLSRNRGHNFRVNPNRFQTMIYDDTTLLFELLKFGTVCLKMCHSLDLNRLNASLIVSILGSLSVLVCVFFKIASCFSCHSFYCMFRPGTAAVCSFLLHHFATRRSGSF